MNYFSRIAVLGFLLICISFTYSCKHEPTGIEEFDTICFSPKIYDIFDRSCGMTGCHDGSEDGFDARSYQSIMQSITPGNANKSEAYKAITNLYFERMPPAPHDPLTKEQRTLIALWINLGAKNSTCAAGNSDAANQNITDSLYFSQTKLPVLQSSSAVSKLIQSNKKAN